MYSLRKSLTIILLLLMSGIFVMPNMAVAKVEDFSLHEQMQHQRSFCDDSNCMMSINGMSCTQHCDHQNVIPFNLPRIPHIHLLSEYRLGDITFLPKPVLLVELKPPQIVL